MCFWFLPGVQEARGCRFCTSESMQRLKCGASGLLQGLMLDPDNKMIPLKTQGAILYRLKSQIERGVAIIRLCCSLDSEESELPFDTAPLSQSEPSKE